ncbi:uncharacterized protein [Oryctolagus cuniculus]|uniref:uncharacterized protein isoform X1 n=1 Tax=Oryctolagus cuniculus TaxID=9986 RepID=UPI0038791A30
MGLSVLCPAFQRRPTGRSGEPHLDTEPHSHSDTVCGGRRGRVVTAAFSPQMSFTSQISCSTQTVTGAVSTIKFFLSEAYLGQHFEIVELSDREPEPGDLFLFRMMSPLRDFWCGAHVGVYCGRGEIIHFEGRSSGGFGLDSVVRSSEGVVCKQGQRPLLRSRLLWRVLRRRGGVDRALLERRVREAMDADPPVYHPTRSNCVHFALSLIHPEGDPGSLVSMDMDLTVD